MSTESFQPAATRPGRTPAVVVLLVLSAFTVILNETIMANAIPRLMDDLEVTEQTAQWVSTAFMLTMAAVIPTTGWLLQRLTTRAVYGTAMGVFLTGTAICALAPVFPILLTGRVIQAMGTAVMMPLLMTTLLNVVPKRDRGRVMGNVTLVMSVAPALGPTVSGVVLQLGSWRLLFVLVLPIAGAVTLLGLRKLQNVGEPRHGTIDWASVLIAALGFGGLVYGLGTFGQGGVRLPIALAVAGLAMIAIFVARQLRLQRTGTPLLDLRTLGQRTYTRALVMGAMAFMVMLGSMMMLVLYLQNLRGLSPLMTGLLVMPGGIIQGLLGPTVGRLFDRYGGRVLVIPGSIGLVVALVGFTQFSATTPYWQLLGIHIVMMISMAATMTPVFTLGLGSLPKRLYAHGSSMLGTLQQVAAAFGTALVVTVMAARAGQLNAGGAEEMAAQLEGMRASFVACVLLSLVVVLMAVLLPKRPDATDDDEPAIGPDRGEHASMDGAADGAHQGARTVAAQSGGRHRS